jgi:hypothetical protein
MVSIRVAKDHCPMRYFLLVTTNIGLLDLVPDVSILCVGRFLPILAIRAMTCLHPGNKIHAFPFAGHFFKNILQANDTATGQKHALNVKSGQPSDCFTHGRL